MSKVLLYNSLKTLLESVTTTRDDNGDVMRFKKVELWANQLDKMEQDNAFLLPACFIEFLPSDYNELSNGVQSYDLTVRLHICFESYKDTDTEVLKLAEATYFKVQGKQYGYFGKFKRRNETQNFDHDMVQDYQQDYYLGRVKEFKPSGLVETQIDTFVTNPDIKVIT